MFTKDNVSGWNNQVMIRLGDLNLRLTEFNIKTKIDCIYSELYLFMSILKITITT